MTQENEEYIDIMKTKDARLAVKMLSYLKNMNRRNPHKGRLMGDVGWMSDLIDMVRDFDKENKND